MDEYPLSTLPKLDELEHDLVFTNLEKNSINIWIFFPDTGLIDVIRMTPTQTNNYEGICTTATENSRLIFDYLVINKVVKVFKTVQSSFPKLLSKHSSIEQYSIHHVKLTKSSLLQLL